MAESAETAEDAVVAEIEKKITKAFEVFDREGNKTVDVREIGCIIRSLGCFPNEAEVQELLDQIEVEDPSGFVHLDKFLPVMTKVLLDERTLANSNFTDSMVSDSSLFQKMFFYMHLRLWMRTNVDILPKRTWSDI
ncbi:dynein regulatory complex protein 8 isoform X2 [Malurus melanocephalus]|uniref:dynein regulatory complex protein 8 isoform X2 n=1 Tax=Malurus melanocephalus TaxID=175006 RepID=UPI0025497FEF|nr:dynein regulatory complex protein 8 isoform X2 [Malurus melanocephalus]